MLFFARYEASNAGAVSIEPSHLLLGLMRETNGAAATLLAHAQITAADVLQAGTATVRSSVEMPFSEATRRVLQRAPIEADMLGHAHISPAHLLLAILAEDATISKLLTSRGVSVEEVRTAARKSPSVEARAYAWSDGRKVVAPEQNAGKPDITPSYTVHIETTARAEGTYSTTGPSWLGLSGFTLRGALARLYDIAENRVVLPATIDLHARYDVTCVLPDDASSAIIRTLVTQAIERWFSLVLTTEAQPIDVYVLTADRSQMRPLENSGLGAVVGGFDVNARVMDIAVLKLFTEVLKASAGISAGAAAANAEAYVHKTHDLPASLLQQLRERLGVVAAPARRDALMLIATPR